MQLSQLTGSDLRRHRKDWDHRPRRRRPPFHQYIANLTENKYAGTLDVRPYGHAELMADLAQINTNLQKASANIDEAARLLGVTI